MEKAGPMPIWVWALAGTGAVAGFMYYRKKKAADAAAAQDTSGDSSNLGNVPISNLTTAAAPMPIQMGDTFVNVNQPQQPAPNNPVTPSKPAAGTLSLGSVQLTRLTSPTVSRDMQRKGFDIYTIGGTQYYNPTEHVSGKTPGGSYFRVSSPSESTALAKKGCKVITVGNTQFYAPTAKCKGP